MSRALQCNHSRISIYQRNDITVLNVWLSFFTHTARISRHWLRRNPSQSVSPDAELIIIRTLIWSSLHRATLCSILGSIEQSHLYWRTRKFWIVSPDSNLNLHYPPIILRLVMCKSVSFKNRQTSINVISLYSSSGIFIAYECHRNLDCCWNLLSINVMYNSRLHWYH